MVGFVEIHAHPIGRDHAEGIGSGFGREEGSGPVNGVGFWIDAIDSVLAVDFEGWDGVETFDELSFSVVHLFLVKIVSLEALLVALVGTIAEGLDDVGDGATMLLLAEAEEILANGVELGLCFGGVKGGVDIGCDGLGVFVDDEVFFVLGHRFVDVFGERFEGSLADEGFVIFVIDSLALVSVAGGAVLGVNCGAIGRGEGERWQKQEEELENSWHSLRTTVGDGEFIRRFRKLTQIFKLRMDYGAWVLVGDLGLSICLAG